MHSTRYTYCNNPTLLVNTRHTGHFRHESFHAINCTGTDNQTITKRIYTTHKITNANTNELAHSKSTKPNVQTVRLYQCACLCATVTQYSTEQF